MFRKLILSIVFLMCIGCTDILFSAEGAPDAPGSGVEEIELRDVAPAEDFEHRMNSDWQDITLWSIGLRNALSGLEASAVADRISSIVSYVESMGRECGHVLERMMSEDKVLGANKFVSRQAHAFLMLQPYRALTKFLSDVKEGIRVVKDLKAKPPMPAQVEPQLPLYLQQVRRDSMRIYSQVQDSLLRNVLSGLLELFDQVLLDKRPVEEVARRLMNLKPRLLRTLRDLEEFAARLAPDRYSMLLKSKFDELVKQLEGYRSLVLRQIKDCLSVIQSIGKRFPRLVPRTLVNVDKLREYIMSLEQGGRKFTVPLDELRYNYLERLIVGLDKVWEAVKPELGSRFLRRLERRVGILLRDRIVSEQWVQQLRQIPDILRLAKHPVDVVKILKGSLELEGQTNALFGENIARQALLRELRPKIKSLESSLRYLRESIPMIVSDQRRLVLQRFLDRSEPWVREVRDSVEQGGRLNVGFLQAWKDDIDRLHGGAQGWSAEIETLAPSPI